VTDAVPSLSSGRGQQGQSGVQGAQVTLIQGHHGQVEQTDTGPHGYFRFDNPPTGNYKLFVKPPAGSGLDGARTQFAHVHGKQTFLKIVLHKHGG
jgi:hypothetical protein